MDKKDRWALQVWESIEALRGIVLFEDVLDALREKADEALELASYLPGAYTAGQIPALPVVPRDLLRTEASNIFLADNIEDVVEAPREPYFLIDVEVGKSRIGLDPRRALIAIRVLHRQPLTLEQAVSLFSTEGEMCPEQVFVLGSVNPTRPRVPIVLKVANEHPPLDDSEQSPRVGAPSFAAII